nr:hypothetical protein [Tanacetum cinerariifolium]
MKYLMTLSALHRVEGRLVEFRNQEIKFCEKIRGLEFNVECKNNRIERLTNELEELKKEKEGLERKLIGFESAAEDLDTLLQSQRSFIEFGDSYKAPQEETCKGPASESSAKKKGRTVVITTEDMQKRRNDVKARTTLLLALPDEHQLRFSKYETAKELWEAILKTFGGNEATKKTKKNQLKQQYGNFKAECLETLEQTFNRLHAIVSHLEFMDVEIKHDDLNQKFLTSLAPEWLMYTIVWKNKDDLDTMSLDDVYNHLKVGKGEVHTASVPTDSTQVSTASTDVAAAADCPGVIKTIKTETARKSPIKYAEMYRSTSKSPKVRGYPDLFVVIAPGMFRINPSKTSREEKHVPNTVSVSTRTKPITVSQPPVITKKDVHSDLNGLSSTGVDNTKTRRPHPRSNTKYDRVPSASKSSRGKNKEAEVEEHHRNLLLSKNNKHISSACNNSKIDSQDVISKGNSHNNIDDKGYWDSGCSRHMTGNISYLS